MGTHKQKLLDKARSRQKVGSGIDPTSVRGKVELLRAAFRQYLPELMEIIEEDGVEVVDFRYYRKKDYQHLGLFKVEIGEDDYVCFAGVEDWIESLVVLDKNIGERGMVVDKWSRSSRNNGSDN